MTLPKDPSVEAARLDAKAAADATPSAPGSGSRFARPGPRMALVVTLVAAIILLTILLPTGAPGSKYTDVHEITAAPAAFDGKTVAVVGGVQSGSVSLGANNYAFNLTDYDQPSVVIRVVYTGGMDANFAADKKVLAEGRIDVQSGVARLIADKISIGCPTDYRGGAPPQ